MMIVCKDTDHATWVENFVKSDEFAEGLYKNKTIVVHSKQSGAESEENTRLLLDVEKYDNPVEIVIHVNMLKEGWDVNNLYTIVPLRTAASKVLREQMIGRGLRLPYGDRTGNEIVDGVYLTAHDKFQDILDEAKKGDSIFKAGNIIKLEEIEENISTTQTTSELDKAKVKEEAYAIGIEKGEKSDELIDETISHVKDEVIKEISHSNNVNISNEQKKKVAKKVKNKLKDNKELSDAYKKNENVIDDLIDKTVEQTCEETKNRFISIPRLKIIDAGVTEYGFIDFDLDLQVFNHAPVKNDLLIQNLQDFSDVKHIDVNSIDFDSFNPKKEILDLLRSKPEIDYEKSSSLLFKLISQVVSHYEEKYEAAQMKNIVFINKKDIANKIYDQMMADDHFYSENSFIKYSVMGVRDYNFPQTYTWKTQLNLYENYNENIKSILFDGIMKGVFSSAKFDSKPELILARILEKDSKVTKWLRPAQNEFNINYNRGKHYVPDFVVETEDYFYIVEVKGEDKIEDADVIAKSKKAVQFCDVVTNWAKENSKKGWKYVFIPSKEILPSSSFNNLVNRFTEV